MIRPILTLTILALATPAAAYTAQNRMKVAQTKAGQIHVQYPAPLAETDYWCAAGDFVMGALHLPGKTRIYRASPKPRKQGQGITFTLNAAEKAPNAGISSFGGKDDGSISASVAVGSYCETYRLFPDR